MPTQLRDFDGAQDALTVFMDYRRSEDSERMQRYLKERFDAQQLLYLSGEECEKTGARLYEYMYSRVQSYEVTLPKNQRLVFCHYIRLNDLDEVWVNDWQSRVQEFQKRLTVTEAFQQYHIVSISYESSGEPLGEEKEEKIKLLERLGTELGDIAHAVYFLYTNGFETLNRQEQGLAMLLYLLGRPDTFGTLAPMKNTSWLKMLSYSDYSEEKAEMWSGKIEEIDEWLTEEADPGGVYFFDAVRLQLLEPADKLRDAEMEFDSRVDIYPVHIDDFVKTGFLPGAPRASKIGSDHPIIQKRKAEYFGDLQERMLAGFDFEIPEKMKEEQMHYRDLQNLSDLLAIDPQEAQSLEKRTKSALAGMDGDRAGEEIGRLIDEVCARLRKRLAQPAGEIERMRQKMQQERQNAQKELNIAGRYEDIRECFGKISEETAFKTIFGKTPEFQKNVCLIGNRSYDRWHIENYEIEGIRFAHYCPAMNSQDVALLKTGDLLDLQEESAERYLMQIL